MNDDTQTPNGAAASDTITGAQDPAGFQKAELSGSGAHDARSSMGAIYDIPLTVEVVLGRSRMSISELMSLSQGSVIALDKAIGDDVDVMINGQIVARGEMVNIGENKIGITLTEIVRKISSTL